MKINWAQNPLATTIELDDRDKEILRLHSVIEQLGRYMFEASYALKDGENFNLDSARTYLAVRHNKQKLHDDANVIYDYCLTALNEEHIGDCTCIPCSCDKCHAESMLDIDTIPGLYKHEAGYVRNAFENTNGTINAAIAWLEAHDPAVLERKDTYWAAHPDELEQHVPRWRRECQAAAVWLRNYQKEHFPETISDS